MKKIFIFGVLIFSFLLFPRQALAQSPPAILINEIMYDLPEPGSDANSEWIELYNTTDKEIDLTGWKINDGDNPINHILNIPPQNGGQGSIKILPRGYLILTANAVTFLQEHQGYQDSVIDTVLALNNTSSTISIIDTNSQVHDQVTYTSNLGGAGDGRSLERGLKDLQNTIWHGSVVKGGTPGAENSLDLDLKPPEFSNPQSPLSPLGKISTFNTKVNFSWPIANDLDTNNEVFYEFELSLFSDFTSSIKLLNNHPKSEYDLNIHLDYDKEYFWRVRATDTYLYSDWLLDEQKNPLTFTLEKPIYSKTVIISEIFPHPSAGADNEFIEFYNSSNEPVDLSGWILDDIKDSGSHLYVLPEQTIIPAGGYLVFYKPQTNIGLNDDGDTVRLLWPDGTEVMPPVTYPAAPENQSYSYLNSSWQWSTTATAGKQNIITSPPPPPPPAPEIIKTKTEPTEPPLNNPDELIPISIADIDRYDNQWVEIVGVVVKTSGRTFYLDDGTGIAKVYIQEKTGIKKPRMYRGDKVKIRGIVDFYRGVWRILPRQQEDIMIIEPIKSVQAEADVMAEEQEEPIVKNPKSETQSASRRTKQILNPKSQILNTTVSGAPTYFASVKQVTLKPNMSLQGLEKIVKYLRLAVIIGIFLLLFIFGESIWKLSPRQPL